MNKLFNYIKSDPALPTAGHLPFEAISSDLFRITTSFNLTGETKAYTMMKGTLLFQQQTGNPERINIILRPTNPHDFLVPIKYVIYRGLKRADFVDLVLLTDPLNKVKTSGNELVVKMKELQDARSPGDDIPIEALFGTDLSPASTTPVNDFFFKKTSNASSLFTIDGGIELGNFAVGNAGIEILLENPDLDLTVLEAKLDLLEFNLASDTPLVKKAKREKVRHFIDPVAFYGLHATIKDGIGYKDAGGTLQTANTADLVYNHIQNQFANKNAVYLDIRNENGYSYNYYGNYVGTSGIATDDNKEFKAGNTSGSLSLKAYYTSEWPIHKVDVISPSASLNENTFYLALRVNDNARPLVASHFSDISTVVVEDKGIRFIDETVLLPIPIPSILPEFTNEIIVKVPNIPGSSGIQPATLVKVEYYKQNLPLSTSTKFPVINFSDYLFGPLNSSSIPFDSGSNVQWITSNHTKYVDALNDGHIIGQQKTPILNIQVATREIELFDVLPIDDKAVIRIENDNGITLNEGTYTIESYTSSINTTTIVTKEPIPGALQTGDNLVISLFVEGELDFTNNTFIIKGKDYSTLGAFISGNQVDFYSNYSFSSSYTITNTVFTSPNTVIQITEATKKIGFAGIIETGFILESDLSVGGPYDDDRLMFYAAPTGYFSTDGVKHGTSFSNKGGASDLESIIDVLTKMMPDVVVEQIPLKPNSSTDINSFAYSSKSKAKEMLFLLGITKTEYQTIPFTSFDSAHIVVVKLKAIGTRTSDLNKTAYYKYEIRVAGLDSSLNYLELPTGIFVYSTDNLIFVSQLFAARYGIDESIAAQALDDFLAELLNPSSDGSNMEDLPNKTTEEINNLSKDFFWKLYGTGKSNKELFNLDPTMATKVSAYKQALDTVPETIADIETLIKQKGADLLNHAKTRIKLPGQPWTNKDGILYLTRLIMQVTLKNHPKILSKFPSKTQDFYDLFEKHSRGLEGSEKPDFSSYSGYKILISGYDPFGSAFPGAYYDWQKHQSNPSGNIALALDGVEVSVTHGSETRKAMIKSVILPVRYEEFDKGWMETFLKPYVDDPDINMIATLSYGINHSYGFEIERFAARKRGGSNDNNSSTNASVYLNNSDKDNYEFLLNKLPFYDMMIKNEVGLDQHFSVNFYNGTTFKNTYPEPDPVPSDLYNPPLLPIPTFANYSSHATLPADRIKSEKGPGGNYLSNEIFYRVAFLREKSLTPDKFTGHIHLGYLDGDPSTDRVDMLTFIKQSFTNSIYSFILEKFMRILDTTYMSDDFFTGIIFNTEEEKEQLSTVWLQNIKPDPSTGLNVTHKGNKELFELDPDMKTKVLAFKKKLDETSVPGTLADFETIVKDTGADLLHDAKAKIRQIPPVWRNKDGIIYITRLIMQVILKNHMKTLTNFSSAEISGLYDLLEKHSRGLAGTEYPDFSGYLPTHKKILISGFDPYGAGFDWEDHNSNSSGNVALALDGTSLTAGSKTANIHSAIFPVRYKEFDAGWVEAFFTPFITTVDMIITVSYGIDTHDFQIDRFASDFRYGDLEDNDKKTSYNNNHNIGDTFIENKLPYGEFAVGNLLTITGHPSTVGINHRAYWEVFADRISPPATNLNVTGQHSLRKQFVNFSLAGYPQYAYWDNREIVPIQKIVPFVNTDFGGNSQVSNNLKYVTPADPDEIKFPSWTNYPSTGSWVANHTNFKIKARIGSGQFYHSNEIHYRVANLRNTLNSSLKTGHIHIGFLTGDPVTDRDEMINAINYMIQKMLNAL